MSVSVSNEELGREARLNRRHDIYKKGEGHCWYCGDKLHFSAMTIDHVTPRCNGGGHEMDNVVPCCKECNSLKGDLDVNLFRHLIRYKLAGRPTFTGAQRDWLRDTFGVDVDPGHGQMFWFETRSPA